MNDNKSIVGGLQPTGSRAGKNSFNILNKQPAIIPLLNLQHIGWSQMLNKEKPPIIDGENIDSTLFNEGITNGPEVELGTGYVYYDGDISLTDIGTPEQDDLRYLYIRFLDWIDTGAGFASIDDETDVPFMKKTYDNITLTFTNGSGGDINFALFKTPIVCPIKVVTMRGTETDYDNHVLHEFMLPIAISDTTDLEFNKATFCNTDNDDSIYSNYVLVSNPTTPIEFSPGAHVNKYYGTISANNYLVRNYKTTSYVETALRDAATFTLKFDVKVIAPLSVDNNLNDVNNNYHIASSGALLLTLSEVKSDGSTVTAENDEYINYIDTSYELDSSFANMMHYTFTKDNDIQFGIALEASAADTIITGAGSVIPFIEYGSKTYYAENLSDVNKFGLSGNTVRGSGIGTTVGAIDDISLSRFEIIEDSINRKAFYVEYVFSYDGSADETKGFFYSFQTTDAFSGGFFISDIDNDWRLYVHEVIGNKLYTSDQDYNVSDYYFWQTGLSASTTLPKFSKKAVSSIYSGNKEYLGKVAQFNLEYSVGHSIMFPDITMGDAPALISQTMPAFANKGFALPILFPQGSPYNNLSQTYKINGNGSFNINSLTFDLFDNSYDNTYDGNLYRHSYLFIPTQSVGAGNVFTTLPPTATEVLGSNIFNNGCHIADKTLTVGNGKYASFNNRLYKASKEYYWNPSIEELALYESGEFYSAAGMLMVVQSKKTIIYRSDIETNSLIYYSSIPAKLSAEPIVFNNIMVLPTILYKHPLYSDGTIGIYIISQDGIILAKVEDYECVDIVTYFLDNGELAISAIEVSEGSYFVHSYIISENLSISNSQSEIEIDTKLFVKMNTADGRDAKVYLTDGGDVYIKPLEANATSDFDITTGKFDIIEQYKRAFMAYKIVITMDKKDSDTAFGDLDLYVGINDEIPSSTHYDIIGDFKMEVEINMQMVEYISYQLHSTSANNIIKDVYLVGYFVEGE